MSAPALAGLVALFDRTLPESGAVQTPVEFGSLNLIFIVGFALLISVLARYLAKRGGRKK